MEYAKFTGDFWSDDDIMNLPADQKLAYVWLKTNARCSNIGYQIVSRRKFRDETCLEVESLTNLFKTLPDHFSFDTENDKLRVLIVGFLGEQWSPGQFSKQNNISLSFCKLLDELPEQFRSVLLDSYKTLASLYQVFKNGQWKSQSLPRPSPVSTQRQVQCSEVQCSSPPSFSGGAEIPDDAEIFRFADAWPGELATGAPLLPREFVEDWLKRMNGRTVGWPLDWRRALVADWRATFRTWQKNGAKNGGLKPWEIKTTAEALQRQIAEHPANEDSSAYAGEDVTEAQQSELTALRDQQRRLSRQMGGVTP